MKRASVCGAGGFIGGHLVKKLKREGYWVRGVDMKEHEFAPTAADEFLLLDLREPENCKAALSLEDGTFDEVYQLAADMGGMGFIPFAECEIMRNNALINIHMTHTAATMGVPRYFFSSSVCVYRDMQPGEPELTEDDAIPADPDNEYGWEKLYAERVAMAYARHYDMKVRIARFQNCYGPEGTWTGGREKAPAAICRKVAEAEACTEQSECDGGTIGVWGDGTAIRAYTCVSDMVEGVYMLMHSDPSAGSGHCLEGPTNIGSSEYVTVDEAAWLLGDGDRGCGQGDSKEVCGRAGGCAGAKPFTSTSSVQATGSGHRFSKARIHSLGWQAKVSLKQGISRTYPWIEAQVRAVDEV